MDQRRERPAADRSRGLAAAAPAGRLTVMQRWARVAATVTLLGAFALRVWRLDAQELRGDEAFGYFFSLRPFAGIVDATFALKEPHPVASYFVQKVWLGWAGHSEYALRFVSVWFGVLAVALLWRLARRVDLSRGQALLAAALLAVSPYAIWHSQDARMYSMSLALTLASTWLAVEWLGRQRLPWAIAYVTVSWLALHTHYFAVFVLAAQSAFVFSRALFLPRVRAAAASWSILQIVLGLLYLPWLAPASAILSGYGGNGDSPGLVEMARRSLSVFAVGESAPAVQQIWWAGLALALLLLGAVRLWRRGANGRRALWLFTLYLAAPLLLTWWGARSRPIFNERYLIAAAPPFYLLIATGFGGWRAGDKVQLWRRSLASLLGPMASLVMLVALVGGMLLSFNRYQTDPAYSKTHGWRDLAGLLARWSASLPPDQVRLAQNFPDPTLWYYYTGPASHLVLPPAPHDADGAEAAVGELAAAGVQRVVLPVQPAANWDDSRIAQTALAGHYIDVATLQVGVWPVVLYVAPPRALEPLAVRFANGVQLNGYVLQPSNLSAGDVLVVQLAWETSGAQRSGSEKVFVQLLNSAGQLVAQDDRPLAAVESQPQLTTHASYAILLPASLAAGRYQLIAGLYDPAQAGAPRILLKDGADHVLLAWLDG